MYFFCLKLGHPEPRKKKCPAYSKPGQVQVNNRTIYFNERTTYIQLKDRLKLKKAQNDSQGGQLK